MGTDHAPGKLLYTPIEAAAALGFSRSTLYVLLADGDLPSIRIGGSRRISVEALHRYIEALSPAETSPRLGAERSR